MSFAIHKQVHPPTGVDHACAAYFTHPIGSGAPPNLVVLQANRLTIYAIRRDGDARDNPSGNATKEADDAAIAASLVADAISGAGATASATIDADDAEVSLEVVAEFDLNGTVGSIATLRRRFGAPREQRDALLLAVRESKLSVVEFDPSTLSLVCSSLHSWETPPGAGGVPSALRLAPTPPVVVADPEGRCAAVLLRAEGGTRLALLPTVEADEFGGDVDEEEEKNLRVEKDNDAMDVDGGDGSEGKGRRTLRGTAAAVKKSYVVDLVREMGVRYVRDVCFLHGYGEPVLLVLHEERLTWAARATLVNDTMRLSAISLNVDARKHTVIWRRSALPHSCYRLTAMPAPLGGAIVLSQNFLLHESQESSAALALNPLAGGGRGDDPAAKAAAAASAAAVTAGNAGALDPSLANPPAAVLHREGTESAVGVAVELDGAYAAVISEKQALVTTKAGALYLLSLRIEGRRLATRGGMHLKRAGGAVLSSGMCLVTRRLLFLGSRVGDSLLVSLKEKEATKDAAMLPAPEGGETKKRKADAETPTPTPLPPPPPINEDDELEAMLYGEGIDGGAGKATEGGGGGGDDGGGGEVNADGEIDGVGGVSAASLRAAAAAHRAPDHPGYTFTVRDSVLGISPVIDLTVGASASVSGDTIERTELIAACGHGKNGALAVLQRGIQPELVTEVESGTLPGLKGTWTVHHDSADNERLRGSAAAAAAQAVDPYHAYLVISLASSTMILETGEELKEVSEHVELVTDAATLCAGNAFGRERIVQVYDKGVRVAAGPVKVQDIASTELVADAGDGEGIEIVAAEISFPYVLCRLSDGSLAVLKGDEESKTLVKLDVDALARLPPGGGIACATLVDDSTPAAAHGGLHDRSPGFLKRATTATATTTTTTASASREDGDDDDDSRRPMFLAVTRTGGALELYSLPSCDKAWTANGLSEGVAVLSPAGSASAALVDRDAAAAADAGADRAPEIVELRVDAFARAHERPLLTALRADGAVLVYRAFTCAVAGPGGRALTQLRFARVPVELEGGGGGAVDLSALPGSRLTRFERVGDRGGIRGVFVSGPQPLWLLARRSRVLALPVRGEAQRVVSFTAFHNVNCHAGFILGTAAGGVRICQIPGRMHYEAAWPVRKLALRCTPHHVQYLPDFKLYALSTSAPAKWVEPEVAEEDIHAATVVKTRRAKAMARGGVEEQFAVKLLVPGSLETAWSRTMDPGEHVQAVKNVQVRNLRTGALHSMLAVGTAMPGGEDTPCRGRVILFEISWQMVDGETRWVGRVACVRDAKMACSALSGLEGHLVVAIGTKLIVHAWDGAELIPVAFFDTPVHTVTINVVKNFVCIGDVQKGAYFFRWKDDPRTGEKNLIQLAKDFESMDVLSTEFLVDGSTLSLLAADTAGNAYVFAYDPKSSESWKGQKLLTKASFHVGSPVHRMVRFKLKTPTGAGNDGRAAPTPAEIKANANRHAVFFGTLDGSLGILVPMESSTHAKLEVLQRWLNYNTAQNAGLNGRSYRAPKTTEGRAMRSPAPHNLLDGEMLQGFESLAWTKQAEAADAAGMTREEALTYLHTLSAKTAFM